MGQNGEPTPKKEAIPISYPEWEDRKDGKIPITITILWKTSFW